MSALSPRPAAAWSTTAVKPAMAPGAHEAAHALGRGVGAEARDRAEAAMRRAPVVHELTEDCAVDVVHGCVLLCSSRIRA